MMCMFLSKWNDIEGTCRAYTVFINRASASSAIIYRQKALFYWYIKIHVKVGKDSEKDGLSFVIKRCCFALSRKSAVAFGTWTSEHSTLELWGCTLWPAAGAQTWISLVSRRRHGTKSLFLKRTTHMDAGHFQARPPASSDPSVGWRVCGGCV